jgi:ABC-type phosphate transport system permease subunit
MGEEEAVTAAADAFRLNTARIRAGAVLVIFGTVVSAVGSLIAGVELAISTTRWLKEQQQSPSAVARQRVRQALGASEAAAHAAAEAWHRVDDGKKTPMSA